MKAFVKSAFDSVGYELRRKAKESSSAASLSVEHALMHLRSGAKSAAMQAAKHAVSLSPDVPRGYDTLSSIMLPGDDYYAVLRRFHHQLHPKSYLEIGIRTGASIVLARSPTVAVGIDPAPCLTEMPQTISKIFPMSSDEYFGTRDVRADLESEAMTLAFIDGSHLFEQALRDFINIERYSSASTLVLIHDCFAIDALTASRERKTHFWTGDVWKIIPCLKEFRPDLDIFTIATPPSGLGVVRGLDPSSKVLHEHFQQIVSRYERLEVDEDIDQRWEGAAMVPNDWQKVLRRLPDQYRAINDTQD